MRIRVSLDKPHTLDGYLRTGPKLFGQGRRNFLVVADQVIGEFRAALEKPLQTLIERNMDALFGVRFVASEHSTGNSVFVIPREVAAYA